MVTAPLRHRLPSGVYLQGVTYETEAARRWWRWLSAEEQALHDRFGAESRRREFVAGRAAARHLLGGRLGRAPAAVPLRRADDGAVEVEGTDWRLSIAHSDDAALVAAARHPVGVDLERIQARDPAVARFLLDDDERHLPEALPYGPDASLILLWTLKEAALKARRSGFRLSPKALRVDVRPEQQTATIRVEDGRTWALVYAELDGFWATVACPGN